MANRCGESFWFWCQIYVGLTGCGKSGNGWMGIAVDTILTACTRASASLFSFLLLLATIPEGYIALRRGTRRSFRDTYARHSLVPLILILVPSLLLYLNLTITDTVERIPRHIQEIIRLEGGNETAEGRNVRIIPSRLWLVVIGRC